MWLLIIIKYKSGTYSWQSGEMFCVLNIFFFLGISLYFYYKNNLNKLWWGLSECSLLWVLGTKGTAMLLCLYVQLNQCCCFIQIYRSQSSTDRPISFNLDLDCKIKNSPCNPYCSLVMKWQRKGEILWGERAGNICSEGKNGCWAVWSCSREKGLVERTASHSHDRQNSLT